MQPQELASEESVEDGNESDLTPLEESDAEATTTTKPQRTTRSTRTVTRSKYFEPTTTNQVKAVSVSTEAAKPTTSSVSKRRRTSRNVK